MSESRMPAERLEYMASLPKTLERFYTPVPERLIEKKPKKTRTGSIDIPYVSWHNVCRLLEFYSPGWEGRVVKVEQIADLVVVVYELTIKTSEGTVTRQATGQERLDADFGDAVCNAEAQAFKRAAAKFGIALDLYDN